MRGSRTGAKYLCMAGGVALNCVANGKIREAGIFDDLWIQPAAGDGGRRGRSGLLDLAPATSACRARARKRGDLEKEKRREDFFEWK